MISPARKLCYQILLDIELRRRFSDEALNSGDMERLDVRDRHLTTEIVYGTLRWQSLLDHVLAAAGSRAWQDVESAAQVLLRMSLYQLWMMDRIPHHASVNDAVELAKRNLGRGIDRYINGILRNLIRTRPWEGHELARKTPDWVRVSLPQWLWERWARRYGKKKASEYALSLNEPPRAAFRLTRNQHSTAQLRCDFFPSNVVPNAYLKRNPPDAAKRRDIGGEIAATVQYQDEASQLIPHLLGFEVQGRRVWDACSAPGGKTAILNTICGESGLVVASDLREERISRLRETLRLSGLSDAAALVADAREASPFLISFDAVLADVPCSGLGTLRRNPEIKWQFHPDKLIHLQQKQKEIIHGVSQAVRPGGKLVYSTCSTEPEENEEVIRSFLDFHPDFELQRPSHPPGIEQWTGQDSFIRTFPCTRPWDGFFAALLMRRRP